MSGAQALRRTVELRPDVLLLDVDLGSENGFDVAQRLELEGHLPGSTVIMISAHAEEDLVDLLATSPAVGSLPKAQLSADAIYRVLESRRRP
jgi:CheY-like chemotaxis protein